MLIQQHFVRARLDRVRGEKGGVIKSIALAERKVKLSVTARRRRRRRETWGTKKRKGSNKRNTALEEEKRQMSHPAKQRRL